jgi:D-sedoheptulose 7-phosphate isomerase
MRPDVTGQLRELQEALDRFEPWVDTVADWGERLADVLRRGGRLLTCGNGGSAAEAQHLAAELVGRFQSERRPFSAIALPADTASLTAIGNDYDFDQVFARQVVAHGRTGDVLMLMSTSGMSTNVLTAANAARAYGITTWALTGRGPNPLASACDDAVAVPADQTATVQEVHLLAVHLLCAAVDQALDVCVPSGPVSVEREPRTASRPAALARRPADQVIPARRRIRPAMPTAASRADRAAG